MAFLDKLNDFAKNIGDKTGDAIETTKLNSKISSEKKEISRLMQKIGEAYYEKYKNGEQPAPELLECFTEIDAHNVAISEAQAEIDKIKAPAEAPKPATTTPSANTSGITCASCGTVNNSQQKFCSGCGAKVEVTVVQEKLCNSCGAKVASGLKFCGECGSKVE